MSRGDHMRITHFELARLKRFDFSRIKRLSVDIKNGIQVIIGRSGSAKSSTLAELNPLFLNKQSFYKGGYKRIDIEHRGDTYTLIGDYSNKSKIYSFIKNGEDLNSGGTSQVQSELVSRHLGYTPLIRDILYSNTRMCQLTKSERKDLLFSLNPVDLSLVVEKHKYMTQEIRKDKTNLAMLYNRKDELLSKILPKDILEEKYKQKEELEKQIQEYSKDEYTLHHNLELLNSQEPPSPEYRDILARMWSTIRTNLDTDKPHRKLYDVLGINKLERDISIFGYAAHGQIDKEDPDREQALRTEYKLLEQKKEDLQKHLSSLMKELDETTRYLKDIEQSSEANIIEQTLKEYQLEYETLCKAVPDERVNIPKEQYDDIRNVFLPELERLIRVFIDRIGTKKEVCEKSIINKCTARHAGLVSHLQDIHRRIETNDQTVKSINNDLSLLPSDPEVLQDACNICDYRMSYVVQVRKLKQRVLDIQKEQDVLYRKRDKLEKAGQTLASFIDSQSALCTLIEQIWLLLGNSPFRISETSLRQRLTTNPQLFLNTITRIINTYPDQYRKQELKENIDKLTSQLAVMRKANLPTMEFVQSLIDKYNKDIAHGRISLDDITRQEHDVHDTLKLYDTYTELIRRCLSLDHLLRQAYTYIIVQASKEFYTNELNSLLTSKNTIIFKLKDIEEELKDQELLLNRYHEEVLAQIGKVEEHKKLCEELEYALSPSTGFIHKNMVDHLNTLINNVNCILDGVCSYNLQLVPLKEDDPLDYTFKARAEGSEEDDISSLSTGQKVMVNLSFTLAFMLSLGITDYPLILDEVIMGLDATNVQKVLEYLKFAVENKYISQLFFVNHDAVLSSGFEESDTICLSPIDVVVPNNANRYVTLETF